ncbi:MAG: hypothetical protein HY675_27970 [Chloroflexi bacterium]|nr:hypothetical protein [Candidatus Methylomirabilis oxyfera]MBI4322348.1 hypothetical protein [Chloroflexota bacterium]
MIYIYLPYGLAFVALGLVMTMAARAPVPVLPRGSLWLLAAFGFLHGAHEWMEMAVSIQAPVAGQGGTLPLQLVNLLPLSVSFALAGQSGIETLIAVKGWPRWSRGVPALTLALWAILAIAIGQGLAYRPSEDWVSAVDALARYVIGFPGSVVAAFGLVMAGRKHRATGAAKIASYLIASAAAFGGYAIFAGLIVPPADFFPASLINAETFFAAVRIPVQAFRAALALSIGGTLAEACIVEASSMQAELNRLREEFISVVSHDLRTPITTIKLGAGYLKHLPAGGHGTDREGAVVRSIETSAKSLSRMVEDLLDASRIEAKRLTLERERVDLRQLVLEVVDRAAEATKGHQVVVDIPEAMPPVEADPGRVEQILVNLLSNAGKYSYPGTEIRVGAQTRLAEVEVSVTNYGPGIAPEDIPSLFARFYRTEEAERGKAPGLGLGLYIAKGLVEAHGGRMWVESEIGKYATFRFTLPLT